MVGENNRSLAFTSCFNKYTGDKGMAITPDIPKGWKGKKYKKLFPPKWLTKLYDARRCSTQFYEQAYREYVLDKLNPKKVYDDINGYVILCTEAYGEFCHRRLVAEWIYEKLGIIIIELEVRL